MNAPVLLFFGTAVAVQFIELHGPDNQKAYVNVAEISTLREPTANDLKHFAHGAHCIVVTTNGKFLAVRETCDAIRVALTAP